ncbi:MAG: class I SAM-dependent methyltransferase [Bryobacteraceae bacterium]
MHAISMQMFGCSLPLPEFPIDKRMTGIGLSDENRYAKILSKKFSFVNTFYDQQPFFDIMDASCGESGSLDFIIASEVFEHIPGSVQPAFSNLSRLLRPTGFVLFSTPWMPDGRTLEHFPRLHNWKVLNIKGKYMLENTTAAGEVERFEDLCFHGGRGQTLEMRLFSKPDLIRHFQDAGFGDIQFWHERYPEFGIIFPDPWSLPCIAKKWPQYGSRRHPCRNLF